MHELPVTQSILDIAVNQAKAVNAARITDVHLVIGQLASIVDDSVQFYWDFVSQGTRYAIGGIFNSLRPSLTLACGTGAGNLSTDNISTEHLLNIHRVARLRPNARWMGTPREAWLDSSIGPKEILEIYNRNY